MTVAAATFGSTLFEEKGEVSLVTSKKLSRGM